MIQMTSATASEVIAVSVEGKSLGLPRALDGLDLSLGGLVRAGARFEKGKLVERPDRGGASRGRRLECGTWSGQDWSTGVGMMWGSGR